MHSHRTIFVSCFASSDVPIDIALFIYLVGACERGAMMALRVKRNGEYFKIVE